MTRRTGFWRAFFGTCSGRDIFYDLRLHSWGRCLWHLFLLSLITGIIIGHVRSKRVNGEIDVVESAFTARFGSEIYTNGSVGNWSWIAPVQDPLKPRDMALPGGGRVYFTGNSRAVPASLKDVTGPVFVWSPAALGIAAPVGSGKYNCVILNTAQNTMENFSGSPASLERVFKEAPQKLPMAPEKMKKELCSDFFNGISAAAGFLICCGAVIWNFSLVLLYTGIFMLMYRLLNGPTGRLRFLTLGGMWKCGIYAAFPPMAVAAFFPVLELPFVSYETVFMVGLLVYWMAVAARLERTPCDEKENCENDQ